MVQFEYPKLNYLLTFSSFGYIPFPIFSSWGKQKLEKLERHSAQVTEFGVFKLDHSQPAKLSVSPIFPAFASLMNWKWEKGDIQMWKTSTSNWVWGIQTGPFTACQAECLSNFSSFCFPHELKMGKGRYLPDLPLNLKVAGAAAELVGDQRDGGPPCGTPWGSRSSRRTPPVALHELAELCTG